MKIQVLVFMSEIKFDLTLKKKIKFSIFLYFLFILFYFFFFLAISRQFNLDQRVNYLDQRV